MNDKKIYYNLKYEPRDIQIEALNFVKDNIRHGKRFMMINAPTGVGKSYFSVMFINWYLNHINSQAKFDILTNSKVLQDQYTREFPFMSSLKGRNSYSCHKHNGTCQEGKEMNKALKKKCDDCPYDSAFSAWMTSRVSITNFHLFDTVHLFLHPVVEAKKPNVLIIDEAHDFESVLCDFISMKITGRTLKYMGLSDPKIATVYNEMSKVRTITDFYDFIKNYFLGFLDNLEYELIQKISNDHLSDSERVKTGNQLSNLKSAKQNYLNFMSDIEQNNIDNWVLEINDEMDKKSHFKHTFTIQPVWSYKYLNEVVWKNYDHVIFMSGTILNGDMFSYLNGLDPELSAYYSEPSPFPVKNRPIYYIKLGKMTYNDKVATWEKQKVIIAKIIKKNIKNKGIIHTVNYELADWVRKEFGDDDRFLFHNSQDRDEVLMRHLQSEEPTILVSPSMMNGIDLKDELSRFQIILKMPYPNISSNKIKKRQSDYKDWYIWKTCCDLIQSYGRSIRSEDDWSETYILDESFTNIMTFNYKYLPDWFTEAIKILK